jgi:hypothetical protein
MLIHVSKNECFAKWKKEKGGILFFLFFCYVILAVVVKAASSFEASTGTFAANATCGISSVAAVTAKACSTCATWAWWSTIRVAAVTGQTRWWTAC